MTRRRAHDHGSNGERRAAQRRIDEVEHGFDQKGSDALSMPLDLLLADTGRSPLRHWVNNYLMGHAPKTFDIPYRNAGPVRVTAAMHRDFMTWRYATHPPSPEPSRSSARRWTCRSSTSTRTWWPASPTTYASGSPVIAPPNSSEGGSRFVLSTRSHRGDGERRATRRRPSRPRTRPPEASFWMEQASKVKDSSWEDHVGWLGSAQYEPLCDAPGTYCLCGPGTDSVKGSCLVLDGGWTAG